MIALYMLAAHLVGDFVLQNRWQAEGKLGWETPAVKLRAIHVTGYCVPFVPVVVVYSPNARYALAFMLWLWTLHFITDSRRFTSTLGDWIAFQWRWYSARGHRAHWMRDRRANGIDMAEHKPSLAPNPWTSVPMMVDQSLHVVQIAVLGALFL